VDKRWNVLKSLRKKVADLERTCRHLEEEVDMSRHESMERSVMDEASGEALRMLHTQIAGLEREKKEAEKREESLREEVGTLEILVKEKTDDVQRLNETLWTRDESEEVLKSDIRDAQEQIDQISFVGEDVKSLLAQAEQANEEEKERHRLVEAGWDMARAELTLQLEELQREKGDLQERLNEFPATLQSRDSLLGVLKEELEAQWKHTEVANEKAGQLEKDKTVLQGERDSLQVAVKTLEDRIGARARMDRKREQASRF
jgi:chromosome segregation ATPase